jgi:transcriptional regulator with XRE-family HTH domain
MAGKPYSPTVSRRRLSAELRRVRTNAKLTLDEVAQRAEISRSTLSNIENGTKKRPQVTEVRAILDACEVAGRVRDEIIDLCRQSRERGWWSRYRDVLPGPYVGLEADAASISTWEPLLVPGLLQTPDYMRTIAQASLMQPLDIDRVVDSRTERQRLLDTDEGPEYWAILDEGAMHRLRQHPDVMAGQVAHLMEMAERPRVTLQMTLADRLHPGTSGPFVIMEFAALEDPTVVYLETDTDGLYHEEPAEVTRYQNLLNHLRLAALRPGETVARLREMT